MERQRYKNPYQLFLGISGIILLSGYINIAPPSHPLQITLVLLFGSICIGSLSYYLSGSHRQATGTAAAIFFLLFIRYLGIRHIAASVAVIFLFTALSTIKSKK